MEKAPFRHGLVVGKFRPPHAGHLYLVRTAANFCERLTVGVFDRPATGFPLEKRVEILREELGAPPHVRFVHGLDEVPVDYGDPAIWEAHMAIFRTGVLAGLDQDGLRAADWKIDAVFTSEDYGHELAERFDAAHVVVDQERRWKDVSATRVRASPAAFWDELPAGTRAGLVRRIVVLGAESTGTSTLCLALRDALRQRGGVDARTRVVPEYGREHTAAKLSVERALAKRAGRPEPWMEALKWTEADFLEIARTQTRWEEAAAREGGPTLVVDTDALATTVWEERYLRRSSPALWALASELPPRALYVLTRHEGVPFVQDGTRDGERERARMTDRFAEVLRGQRAPVLEVDGPVESRVAQVLARLEGLPQPGF